MTKRAAGGNLFVFVLIGAFLAAMGLCYVLTSLP